MRGWMVAVLAACGGGESTETFTISLEKPELRRCVDGEVCPVMGEPSGPGRCANGQFCNQVIASFTSEPAGLRCGTSDDGTECIAEFPAGTSVRIVETHQATPGTCPIFGCSLSAEGVTERPMCGTPFTLDRDYTLSFACIAP